MTSLKDRLILVVDDEPRMRRFIRMNLEVEGCHVIEAADGLRALKMIREEIPDVVILDVMMPNMDGFETLHDLRGFSDVPVIMLTVRSEEDDRVRGLELGADDYLSKPFSPRELVSRIRALLRRAEMTPSVHRSILKIDDDLAIDFAGREVIVRGERVKLRPTEWRLLYHLVSNAGWVMSHEVLLSKVWGPEYRDAHHYVRLYITYLRQKIEEDPSNPKYILTERGMGYRFVDFEGRPQRQISSLPPPA